MAYQPSNPSNLGKLRAVVEQLADPEFPRDPATVGELLEKQGLPVPASLGQLGDVPDADKYQELLEEIDAYAGYLVSPEFLEAVCKLGPIPLFGLHCPYTSQKLGHPDGP